MQTAHPPQTTASCASSPTPQASGQLRCPPLSIGGDQLFQGKQEILIEHNGDTYRLRITKSGKLILTK